MLNKHWQKLLKEDDDMSSAASAVWTVIIFGGVCALITLYLLDTKTELHPALKGLAALGCGGLVGCMAAGRKWFRVAAISSVILLTVLYAMRGCMQI
jgi:hypothetical protein